MQPSLLDLAPRFDGADIEPHDHARLAAQIARVFDVIKDGQWWPVHAIAHVTGDPEPSVSAQLRNLRKPRFGAYVIHRKREQNLTFYKLVLS